LISSNSKFDFDNEWLFYLALLLAVIPLWLTHFLPGVDLPGHAAQAAALKEIWHDNPVFTDLFEVKLSTPYLTGTILLAMLSYLVPIGMATKLIMSAVVVATPIISGRILSLVGGNPGWRYLIIPSTYSFAFYWGFFPFVIAVPFGLIFLLLAVRLNQKPSVRLGIFIATYSIFLFFSHLLVLCFFSLLALAWLAGSNFRTPLRLALLSIPYSTPLPLITIWLYQTLHSGTYMADDRIEFGPVLKRGLDIIVQFTGLDGTFFVVSLFVFIAIIALPYFSGMKLTRRPEKWVIALCGFATFMLFPSHGMGVAFLYERFGIFLPILWFILWERTPAETTRWHWIGILAVFIWSGANMLRFSTFNIETRKFETLLTKIEPGERVLSIVRAKYSSQFTAPVFLHLPSWYQAEHGGVVDYSFAMFYGTVVGYKPDKRPPDTGILAWRPESFDWQKMRGDNYDYFVIRSPTDISTDIFKDRRSSIELVHNDGPWWLYKSVD